MARAVSVDPVKAIPAILGIGNQRRADTVAVARQQRQHVAGNARLMQQAHRRGGDQRGLLGGLGDHGIAGG